MAIYKKGDILYAAFPYTDIPLHKRRPVVVLSPPDYQKQNQHIIGVMITTTKDSEWQGDYKIQSLKSTGLKHESYVRFKFFTLPLDLIIKPLGKLSTKDRDAVLKTAGRLVG